MLRNGNHQPRYQHFESTAPCPNAKTTRRNVHWQRLYLGLIRFWTTVTQRFLMGFLKHNPMRSQNTCLLRRQATRCQQAAYTAIARHTYQGSVWYSQVFSHEHHGGTRVRTYKGSKSFWKGAHCTFNRYMILVDSTIGMLWRELGGMQISNARHVTITVIVGYIHFNLGLAQ